MTNGDIEKYLYASALSVALLSGCVLDQSQEKARIGGPEAAADFSHHKAAVWAVNIGGGEYLGMDGIEYQADTLQIAGETGHMDKVLGSQDSFIYKTYRSGELGIR